MKRGFRLIAFLSWFWVVCAGMGLAQVTTGTISGLVKDETGAVLPGTTVTIKNVGTGIARTALADDEGRYRVTNLSLGEYEVEATLQGFQTVIRRGITLTIGREALVNLDLKVGEITEQMVVTGEAPLVEVTSSSLGGLVDQRSVLELPLNGRSFQQLALLQPGVLLSAKVNDDVVRGSGIRYSASGTRYYFNMFLMDGSSISDPRTNTLASVSGSALGVEAVREFKVLTNNYNAEYGSGAGALVNVVTKSGTNEFHGSLYEFYRNSALDARNFFDVSSLPFTRNHFGGMLEGPIIKEKTFFVGNYEGLRQTLNVTRSAVIPDENARRGIIPGRAPIQVAPQVKPYLDLYPVPNGRNFGNGTAELVFGSNQPIRQDFFMTRVDHQFSMSDSLFARYRFEQGTGTSNPTLPMFEDPRRTRSQNLALEEKKIISPSLLNVFRAGYNRVLVLREGAPSVKIDPSIFTIRGAKHIGGIDVVGLVGPGMSIDTNSQLSNTYEYSDAITYVRGRHSLKTGAEIKRFQTWVVSEGSIAGRWSFSSLADFLTARPAQLGALARGSITKSIALQSLFGFYVQDDVRWNPRLTFNLGLRYEFFTTPYERDGHQSNLRNHLVDTNLTLGKPLFRNHSFNDVAPRVGFAWDMTGDGKTALRGGFGVFFSPSLWRLWANTMTNSVPFRADVLVNNPVFPTSIEALPSVETLPLGLSGIQVMKFEGLSTSYVMQYNLSAERELVTNTVFSIAYVGSRGVHLTMRLNANTPIPEVLSDGRRFIRAGTLRRNPALGSVEMTTTDANSSYNSLQIGVMRRLTRGLQLQGSYTFSKSIDDISDTIPRGFSANNTRPQDPDDRKGSRGLADFDVRNQFVLSSVWEMPWGKGMGGPLGKLVAGWQLNGIVSMASGSPFSIELGFDQARVLDFSGSLRPNLKPGSSNNPVSQGNPSAYFDVGAFALQPAGFFGNLGRNTMIGPGLVNCDFSLTKNTAVGEKRNLQFRAEFFNLLNRANFQAPIPSGAGAVRPLNRFGEPVPSAARLTATATTSRQVQFGLKLLF